MNSVRTSLVLVLGLTFACAAGFAVGRWFDKPSHVRTVEPSSPLVTFDTLGRLEKYPGKDAVPCPRQTSRTAVVLVAGQSNAGNSAGERHVTRHRQQVLNFFKGQCFSAASPLLGSTGLGGEPWTLLGDLMIENRDADVAIFALSVVAGSPMKRWVTGGDLHVALIQAATELQRHYRITHAIWQHGEADALRNTPAEQYASGVRSIVEGLKKAGVTSPMFVSVSTRCGPRLEWRAANSIAAAQRKSASLDPMLRVGPDIDDLLSESDRFDDCHYSASGVRRTAAAWHAVLTASSNSYKRLN